MRLFSSEDELDLHTCTQSAERQLMSTIRRFKDSVHDYSGWSIVVICYGIIDRTCSHLCHGRRQCPFGLKYAPLSTRMLYQRCNEIAS